jgi:hypothetical protein
VLWSLRNEVEHIKWVMAIRGRWCLVATSLLEKSWTLSDILYSSPYNDCRSPCALHLLGCVCVRSSIESMQSWCVFVPFYTSECCQWRHICGFGVVNFKVLVNVKTINVTCIGCTPLGNIENSLAGSEKQRRCCTKFFGPVGATIFTLSS